MTPATAPSARRKIRYMRPRTDAMHLKMLLVSLKERVLAKVFGSSGSLGPIDGHGWSQVNSFPAAARTPADVPTRAIEELDP
jgi:hypothetical protein